MNKYQRESEILIHQMFLEVFGKIPYGPSPKPIEPDYTKDPLLEKVFQRPFCGGNPCFCGDDGNWDYF